MRIPQNIPYFKWLLFLSIGTFGLWQIQVTFAQNPQIVWKDTQTIQFSSTELETESLQNTLQRFVNQYANEPQKIFIAPSVSGTFTTPLLQATSAESAFQWVLIHYALAILVKEEQWWILPQNEVWRQQPYQKLIVS